MTVTCANCQHITNHRNASQKMYTVKQGFCGCALKPAYEYLGRLHERDCKDFVQKAAA